MVKFVDNSQTRKEVVKQIKDNMNGKELRFIEGFTVYKDGFFVTYVTDKGRETRKFGYDTDGKAQIYSL